MVNDEALWLQLLTLYGENLQLFSKATFEAQAIDLSKVEFLVPLEPHVSLLFRAMVDGLSKVKDVTEAQQGKEASRRDIMANRAIMRARRAILEGPIKAWHKFVRSERVNRRRATSMCARILHRGLTMAFNTWVASRFKAGGVDEFRLRGFLSRLRHVGKVKAFGTWQEQWVRRQQLRAVLMRMKKVPVVKAMNRWLELAREVAEARAKLRGCLESLSPEGRAKRKAFNSWQPLGAERRSMMRVVAALVRRGQRKALSAWLEYGMERAEKVYAMRKAVNSMQHSGMRAAFNSMLEFADKAAEAKRRMRSAAGAFKGDGVRKAWLSWCELLRERLAMDTALRRLKLRTLYVGFRSWCVAANAKPRGGERILASWFGSGREKRKALNSWVEYAQQRKNLLRAAAAIVRRGEYLAFSTWAVAVMGRAKRLAAMGRTVASLRLKDVRAALNSWIEWTSARMEAQRRLRSAGKTFMGDNLRKGWFSWQEMVEARHSIAAALRRFTMHKQHQAFGSWREFAEEAGGARAKKRGVLASLSPEGRAMRKGFNSWCEATEQVSNMRRALSALVNRSMRLGWNAWAEYAQERAAALAAMSKAAGSLRNRGMRSAFNGWSECAAELSENQRKLKAAASAFTGNNVRKAWMSWLDASSQQLAMRRAVSSIIHRGMRLGFNAWRQNAEELKAGQSAMRIAIASIANRPLRGALNGWLEFVEIAHADQRRLRGAVTSMMQRELRQGFNSWQAIWMQLMAMLKAASFLVKRGMRLGFAAWTERVQALREQREQQKAVLRHAFISMQNRQLRPALNAWSEHARQAAEDKRRLLSAGKALMGDNLRKGWFSWQEMVEARHSMATALRRFMMQSQHQAFGSWREFAEEAGEARAKLKGAMAALSPEGRAKRKGFNSWREAAEQVNNMRRALSALVNRSMLMGWNAWAEYAQERAAGLAAMGKAVSSLRNRGMRSAFNGWSECAAELSEGKRRLKAAASAFKGDGMRKAWNQWLTAAAEGAREKQLATKAVSRLMSAPLARAWASWLQMAEERAHALQIAERASQFMMGGTGRAWNQWCSLMDQWYRLRRFARRLLRRDLVRAWGQWEAVAEERSRLQRFAKRALNGDLTHAWLKWHESLSDTDKMRRFTARLMNRGLAAAYDTWAGHVEAANRARKRLRPFGIRLRQRGLSSALNKWCDVAAEGRRMRAIGHRMLHRGLVKALNCWMEMAYERARMTRLLKRVVARVAGKMVVRTFEAWAAVASESREEREERQRRALNMMRNKEIAAVFYAWAAAVEALRVERTTGQEMRQAELAAKFYGRYRNQLAAKCFLVWAAEVVERRLAREATVRRSLQRMRFGALSIALHQWQQFVADAKRERADTTPGSGLTASEAKALQDDVANLRRQLTLTRKELKEVSCASARRYELAIVRAELLARPSGGGGDEEAREDSTFAPTIYSSLWKYAAPFLPDEHEKQLLAGAKQLPPVPPSSFLRQLQDNAPLSFPTPALHEVPPDVPPGVPTSLREPIPPNQQPKAMPARPASAGRRLVPASGIAAAPAAAQPPQMHSSGLQRSKSKEELVGQSVQRTLHHAAERLGIHGTGI